MQIDFHFGATYAIARIAGFTDAQAATIAAAAQYVDDSTTTGFIRFDNGVRYHRQATAHPTTDPLNVDNDVAALSWLPFHFLPGNDQQATPAPLDGRYVQRLVCRPDSPVARAMMADVVRDQDKPHALHRLGIAAHVFIDTFAHQGFVGQRTPMNDVSDIRRADGSPLKRIPVPPIGHGQVSSYPDQPALHWRYTDSTGRVVDRDNPAAFLQAADRLCQEFRRYRLGDPDAAVEGLGAAAPKVAALIAQFTQADGESRLDGWLGALAHDHFGFGAATPRYVGKGKGSWKHAALGDFYLQWLQRAQDAFEKVPKERRSVWQRIGAALVTDSILHVEAVADHFSMESFTYPFDERFLSSDYKRFHDAAEDQRYAVFKKVLPSFGIHAA